MSARRVRRLIVAGPLLLAAAGGCAGAADDPVRAAAAPANPAGMLYRVGLDVGHHLVLASDKPFQLADPSKPERVWKDAYTGELTLVADGGPEGEPASVFRIQVGAFATEQAAEQERAALEKSFGAPGVVRFVPDRGSWRVRLGAAPDRAALAPLLAKLRDAGRKGIWIAEEPAAAAAGVSIRLIDAAWDSRATGATRLLATPAPGSLLKLQGKAYRGAIEIRVDGSGRLRAIDWVELESYLRGVVPAELGPEIWPQLAALKAQAVAARTYALANVGQFEEDGYDVCATPRCQAYGGTAAEHPLSDRAVSETRGEIAAWEGRAIDALYTATCGGHTEDAKEIFPEQAAPYLVGVPCRAEDEALARTRGVVRGAAPRPVTTELGDDVTREAALLSVAGVFGPVPAERLAKELARAPSAATLRDWTRGLARAARRPEPTGTPIEPATLGRAALALARDLGWDERARVLLSDADLDAVLRDPAAAKLPAEERRALTYLVGQGAFRPTREGRWPLDHAPTGATLAAALARIGEAYDALDLDEGTVARVGAQTLELVGGRGGTASLPLAASPFLFTAAGTRTYAVSTLQLWPGDKVRYRLDAQGRIALLELRPPAKGIADDRTAAVYAWEVRKTARELEEAIDKRLSIGTLTDLRVARRGVSGRIVELEVVGTTGSATVKGFDVRNLLDLRESLTVIELQRDPSGRITGAVFSGKGWGHGVGLCQVGAYGMAVRGADYKEILAHYYPGTSVIAASAAVAGAP